MRIVALVTENKHGMAVDLFATEAAALADVRRELVEHFDLDAAEAETMDSADLGQWIAEEGHTYSFTFQDIAAPSFRITVTDLTTDATLSDRLVTGDRAEAQQALGSDWNRFCFGHKDREAVLWRPGQEEFVDRIIHEPDPLTEAEVAHLTDEGVRKALLGDDTLLDYAIHAARTSWWADNHDGDKVALDLEPKAYAQRERAMLDLDNEAKMVAMSKREALRRYWL